jgi:hypothetical protein
MFTPDDPDHTPPQYVMAEPRAGSLIATRRVGHHASGFTDLAAFAETLAANWRDRPDERVWESIEHDLRIQHTMTGTSVRGSDFRTPTPGHSRR